MSRWFGAAALLVVLPASPVLAAKDDAVWRACMDVGRYETSVAACTMLIETSKRPADREVGLLNRGAAHLVKGDYEGAIPDFDAALAIEPRQAYALYGRALARKGSGDEAGAKADLDAALASDPQIAERLAAPPPAR